MAGLTPKTTTEREYTTTGEHVHGEKKKGFFEKLFGAEEETLVEPHQTETPPVVDRTKAEQAQHDEHRISTGKVETTAMEGAVRGHETRRVIDERDVAAHKRAEAHVVEEKEIVAPVEHRKVIEERVPHEHVRVIEERQRLSHPVVAQAERRKVIDTKEDRKPVERHVIETKEIRVPIEHVRIVEEVFSEESVQLREEREKIGACAPGAELTGKEERFVEGKRVSGTTTERVERKEAGTTGDVRGAEVGAGAVGAAAVGARPEGRRVVDEKVEKKPVTRRVVDEGDVTGVVEIFRRIEEIERYEVKRIIEEREPLAEPKDLHDFKRTYKAKEKSTLF